MASTNFQTIAIVPSDNDNTNKIATMKNIQVLNGLYGGYGGRISTLETNYSSLSSTVSGYGTRIGTLESNYTSLSNTTTTNTNNITTNTNNISTLSSNYTTLNNQTTTNTNNITSLQNKVRYDIGIFSSGTCLSSERIFDFTVPVAFTIPANLTGSVAKARIAATSAFVFTVRKNGTSIGTINFAANALSGTFSTSATSFAVGDQLDILAQSATDAISDITFTLVGSR